MPLIAPSVCRYTIVGSLHGQDCQNVLDVRITEDTIQSRDEHIARIAGDLLNQWSDHVLPLLTRFYTAEAVRWVDLDSLAGGTGQVSSTDGSTWPENGAQDVAPLPNNTYVKVRKNLEGKTRIQRNGALRLGGIPEGATEPTMGNTLLPSYREAVDTAFESLKDGINEGIPTGSANLVVVHTQNLAYTGYSEIATFSAAPTLGTIRRRMPGYGT